MAIRSSPTIGLILGGSAVCLGGWLLLNEPTEVFRDGAPLSAAPHYTYNLALLGIDVVLCLTVILRRYS